MKLIDTHCHLYSSEFKEDIHTIIASAKANGVQQFYLPAIDRETASAMLALEQEFTGECFCRRMA